MLACKTSVRPTFAQPLGLGPSFGSLLLTMISLASDWAVYLWALTTSVVAAVAVFLILGLSALLAPRAPLCAYSLLYGSLLYGVQSDSRVVLHGLDQIHEERTKTQCK